jgi:hypothetical protein
LTPENIELKYMGGFVRSLIQNALAFNFSTISAVVRSKSVINHFRVETHRRHIKRIAVYQFGLGRIGTKRTD